ncbi:hypothetical protein C922_05269 [Plasmodium inui San Antonio 1]|uniref:Uncharacterized protein n=1 Tax=Plasmodium inui San Antonio 1 TaxID=1237626 RepID=W6ZYH2_9APIC|nr:hypothetical protein C922_05269 [Plasmodium inui San Antonio 1]EUD64350.1 hypothetical protein C922_05269 [Plasmodium inui San Antonio 1]
MQKNRPQIIKGKGKPPQEKKVYLIPKPKTNLNPRTEGSLQMTVSQQNNKEQSPEENPRNTSIGNELTKSLNQEGPLRSSKPTSQ